MPETCTVQCIEGSLDITTEGGQHARPGRSFLYLEGDVLHGVTALEDTSALVTVVLKK